MVERISHSEYRANLDEYENRAGGGECFVITDEDDAPDIALIPYALFQQCARELAPQAYHISELPEDVRQRILNAKVPEEPPEGEIDVDTLTEFPGHCLNEASEAPLLITMHGKRRWALLSYDVLKQLHSGDRQVLDKLLSKRPRPHPPDRDYTDEETLAILEGRMPDPEAAEESERPDEPKQPDEPQR